MSEISVKQEVEVEEPKMTAVTIEHATNESEKFDYDSNADNDLDDVAMALCCYNNNADDEIGEDLDFEILYHSGIESDPATTIHKAQRETTQEFTEYELEATEEDPTADQPPEENKPKVRRTRAPINQTGPPFVCEHCGHLSATRSLLASHRHRKHRLKENPFHCAKCEKRFDTVKQLERHMKRPTCNVYPEFNCEYCNKKCIGLSNYNIHLRFHKKQYPYVCHLCAKSFMMATHLNEHVKTKHENQRFICEHPNCGKLFSSRHSLKIHAYVHVEQLPYKCDYCDRMHPSKGRLRFHIKKTHGIQHSLEDLDRMLVAEEISIKAELKPILFAQPALEIKSEI